MGMQMTMTEEKKMRFGPSGNADCFYAEGYKASLQAPQWLAEQGLSAYEYPFGRGVTMSVQTAEQIRAQAIAHHISVSVHAPYYINLANPDPEKREASFRYILDAAQKAAELGAQRVIVHVGAAMKMQREDALQNCRDGLTEAYKRLDACGLSQIILCPETMGKYSQIGDLQETLAFCLLDERMLPCIDFAHLHALGGGSLNCTEDFAAVLDTIENTLGMERARSMHMHFSTIEYTAAGEKRHRTFAEEKYGPRFEHLAPLLHARGYHGTVICESKGTQADDAITMKKLWDKQG